MECSTHYDMWHLSGMWILPWTTSFMYCKEWWFLWSLLRMQLRGLNKRNPLEWWSSFHCAFLFGEVIIRFVLFYIVQCMHSGPDWITFCQHLLSKEYLVIFFESVREPLRWKPIWYSKWHFLSFQNEAD